MWILLLTLRLAAADEVDDLLRAQRWGEAIDAAAQIAVARPSDIDAQERYIDLLVSAGRAPVAYERYATALKDHPGDADLQYLAGRAATDAALSRRHYQDAVTMMPGHARSWMGLAAVERASGDLRAAAELYQKALQLDASLGEAWGGLLACVIAGGDLQAARAVAEAATAAAPRSPEGWLAVAMLAPDQAEVALRNGVGFSPEDARLHAALAEQLLRTGRGDEALSEARAALRWDPQHHGARLAALYAASMAAKTIDVPAYGRLVAIREGALPEADARAAADQLVAAWPRSPLPWMARAGLRAATDVPGARADLEQALQMDPGNDEVEASLGMLLQRSGAPKDAVPHLKAAALRRPDDASLLVALARAQAGAGDRPSAIRTLTEAEQRLPWDPIIPLVRAELIEAGGDKEQAYKVVKAAWERIGDSRIYVAYAAAARAAGHYEEAAALYEDLAARTGSAELAEQAKKLRALANPTP